MLVGNHCQLPLYCTCQAMALPLPPAAHCPPLAHAFPLPPLPPTHPPLKTHTRAPHRALKLAGKSALKQVMSQLAAYRLGSTPHPSRWAHSRGGIRRPSCHRCFCSAQGMARMGRGAAARCEVEWQGVWGGCRQLGEACACTLCSSCGHVLSPPPPHCAFCNSSPPPSWLLLPPPFFCHPILPPASSAVCLHLPSPPLAAGTGL